MKIPEQTIQQILKASDIVQVVGHHITLEPAGEMLVAKCPFHLGEDRDFQVDPRRQVFKCCGCGIGGGPARFIMEMFHISFAAALRKLADRAGIQLSQDVEAEPPAEEARMPTAWIERINLQLEGISLGSFRQGAPGTQLKDASLGEFSIMWRRPLTRVFFDIPESEAAKRDQLIAFLHEVIRMLGAPRKRGE